VEKSAGFFFAEHLRNHTLGIFNLACAQPSLRRGNATAILNRPICGGDYQTRGSVRGVKRSIAILWIVRLRGR
jgi:hypothetical protein